MGNRDTSKETEEFQKPERMNHIDGPHLRPSEPENKEGGLRICFNKTSRFGEV